MIEEYQNVMPDPQVLKFFSHLGKKKARSSSSRLEREDAPYKYKLKDASPKFL